MNDRLHIAAMILAGFSGKFLIGPDDHEHAARKALDLADALIKAELSTRPVKDP